MRAAIDDRFDDPRFVTEKHDGLFQNDPREELARLDMVIPCGDVPCISEITQNDYSNSLVTAPKRLSRKRLAKPLRNVRPLRHLFANHFLQYPASSDRARVPSENHRL